MHWLTECMHVSHRYTYILCKDSTSAFYNCSLLVYALAFTQLAAGESVHWRFMVMAVYLTYLHISFIHPCSQLAWQAQSKQLRHMQVKYIFGTCNKQKTYPASLVTGTHSLYVHNYITWSPP